MESLVKPHSYLKKISGTDAGKIYPLTALVSTIGRDIHNTICLQDRFLSRKHCCIKYENPNWVLSDCGGINGTFVNGDRLPHKGTRVFFGKGKPIIFLGDPEESTCGFIFSPCEFISLSNISCPDPSKVLMPTSSSSSANNPGPSSSANQERPFPSSPIECSSGDEPVLIEEVCQPLRTVPKHTSLVGLDRSEQERLERCKESIKAMRQNFTGMEQPARMRTFPCVYESGTLKPCVTRVGSRYPLYHSIDPPITSSVGDNGSSRPSGEGCSRTNPPEFNVLDMLVDSVTSDLSSDDSDCSISSTDSLRTRIRKQKEKKSKTGKYLKASFGAKLSNTQKKNLPVVESQVSAVDEQDTSCSQDSESLIHDMEDEVQDCVSEIENGDWGMAVSKPMDSDALQYLKERVLKLQKTVMDASEELKKALEKNKTQEAVIQELQGKQGISQEELCEDLENELSCNICTEILIKPIILDCGHIFCEYCIAVWKKKKKQCPNCREPIRMEKEIKVLNSYLSKAVERLETSYCNKRKELIETRSTEVGKLKKSSRKRSQPYRVPVPPASGNEANPDIISELRVYRSFHSNRLQRNALALQLRSLRNERPTGVRENPLLRRLVERIERNLNHEAVP